MNWIGEARVMANDELTACVGFFYAIDVPQPEQGAIVTRMAPSWLRFGNFEIFHSRKDKANVKRLADYVLKEVVKIDQNSSDNTGNRYENLLRQVAKSTADMVAGWQSVGKWCLRRARVADIVSAKSPFCSRFQPWRHEYRLVFLES
jgi:hypothetical protein